MNQNDLFPELEIPELPESEGRVCVKCGVRQPEENFGWSVGRVYRRTDCKTCTNDFANTRSRLRKENPYPDEGYQCPICGRKEEEVSRANTNFSFVLDHCHETNQFRGWLCDYCNRGLGAFNDSVEIMKKAIDYLQSKS
jgi:DNA-directed RNA polymerase subunit RPC12/RpoP